jgi:drug/metabolite transporter (DMT)-like permease
MAQVAVPSVIDRTHFSSVIVSSAPFFAVSGFADWPAVIPDGDCYSGGRSVAPRLVISWHSFGWLLLLALLIQTAGWLFITSSSSLPRLPASVSSLLLLVQPAGAMFLAAIILGQQPALFQVAGAVLVCCGLYVVAVARPRAG